jgi:hypothetical protein
LRAGQPIVPGAPLRPEDPEEADVARERGHEVTDARTRWSDVDEAGAVIRIERAQWHGIVGETKTGNLNRA